MRALALRARQSLRGLKRRLWRHGIFVGRFDPDRSLDASLYLLFHDLRINCVLDVGAHHGEYAVRLRQHGYHGYIASFEPIAASQAVLKARAQADPRWHVYPYALGSEDTVRRMNVPGGTNWASFRSPTTLSQEWFAPSTVERTEDVTIRRLDGLFEHITAAVPDPRVYLKMDTQGWDLEVLAGATGCLDQILAAQSEMAIVSMYEDMPTLSEALPRLQALGFWPTAVFPVTRAPDRRLVEVDCVFIRTRESRASSTTAQGPARNRGGRRIVTSSTA